MDEKGETTNNREEEAGDAFVEVIKRQRVADEVYSWLSKKKRRENPGDRSIPSFQEMAEEVLKGLQDGEIFFIVQDPKDMKDEVKARLLKIRTRKKGIVLAAALAVRSDVEKAELLNNGDGQIKRMYEIHTKEIKQIGIKKGRDRVTHSDNIDINMEGIGRFPEFVEEK